MKEKRLSVFLCILALALQNLAIYWYHYAGTTGFPFDFNASFSVNLYWITHIQLGHFPQWVAEQAMGYPLQMDLQTGLFYPGYWLFMLLGQAYSLHAAVVMQCLHVLLGAVGMYVLCRRLQITSVYALPGALAYQFFGGFFSAAGHIEIVRSYAILPWLLSALIIPRIKTKDLYAAVLVPSMVYLQFTGGYAGISLTSLFMLPLFLATQVFGGSGPMAQKPAAMFRYLLLIACGVLLASAHLIPLFFHMSELVRAKGVIEGSAHYFRVEHFFTLFLSEHSTVLLGDTSMRSAFITLPIFVMLFFIRIKHLKDHLPLVVVMLVSVLMITASPFYTIMKTLVPFLGFSRMLAADYRGFLAIPLIILSVAALQDLIESPPRALSVVLRAVAAALVVMLGSYILKVPSDQIFYVLHAGAFVAVFILLTLVPISRKVMILVFTAGVLLSGFEMHFSFPKQWVVTDHINKYKDGFNYFSDSSGEAYDYDRQVVGAASLRSQFLKERTFRPARRDCTLVSYPKIKAYVFDWRGYLTGYFMLGDYGNGMALARQFAVRGDPVLQPFMAEQSRVLLLPADQSMDLGSVKDAVTHGTSEAGSVTTSRYSAEELVYDVSLPSGRIVVENEMYFPGWRGIIRRKGDADVSIKPIAAGGLLRAWSLPAGNYEFRESFEMPLLKIAAFLSAFTFILWIAYVAILFKQTKLFERGILTSCQC